ncbi:hypothetical protein P171DRAFT_12044 [Karstenula rhodostoma CBS 690.94]|uniref:Copper-fist domain-containing protein n=1 Tax=Karstenula rhodostoma CBS 690.94 TaxID=1392251 RepID=A0A9P4PZL5_9PLEO|nr:hypothetical protein P171DRAFT_12044 [Karstenula rhodostoma CBS 690.94]
MWAEVNGEKKKVACGPCIRGHRSSKCDHRDRVLVEVRKPGRPLSSCPHPTGSCSCERVVINYTIPKSSECACPSDAASPVLVNNGTGRVQKPRGRKSTVTTFSTAVLEKAIKAAQDGETDSSSHLTRTPTSESNNASMPSSASSTPRLAPLQKDVDQVIAQPSAPASPPATSQGVSSCCKPEPVQAQSGSCCSSKAVPPPQPEPAKKSCCGGSAPAQPAQVLMPQPHMPQNYPQHVPTFNQYPAQFQQPPFGMPHPGSNFVHSQPPFSFNTPIYNHMASGYQPPVSMPMTPIHGHAAHHNPDHNCHCGDACSCFGCAAHPNNATMIEYVRSMHQFMSTGQFGAMPPPTYDVPSYPHQPGFGAEAHITLNPMQTAYLPATQMNFQPSINTMTMQHPPMNLPGPWPQTSTPGSIHGSQTTATAYFEHTIASSDPATAHSREPSIPPKAEEQVQSPTFTDSPSEGKEEDTVTLSPSAFLWQEMVLPGCNDATGTCQCGDGCECVGCLTHGGHNGVTLEMMEGDGQDTFPDFATPADTSSSNQFAEFPTAPT